MYELVWYDEENGCLYAFARAENIQNLANAIVHIRNGVYKYRQKEFFINHVVDNVIKESCNFVTFCIRNGIERKCGYDA